MAKRFYHENDQYGMISYGQMEEIIPYHTEGTGFLRRG